MSTCPARVRACTILVALALSVLSCSQEDASRLLERTEGPRREDRAPFDLPFPASLKAGSELLDGPYRNGADIEPNLPDIDVGTSGSDLLFQSSKPEYFHGLDLSLAGYSLNMTSYDHLAPLHLAWSSEPIWQADYRGLQNRVWVGLSNYSANRWDWHEVKNSDPLSADFAPCVSPGGIMYVVVVLQGPGARLAQISVSQQEPAWLSFEPPDSDGPVSGYWFHAYQSSSYKLTPTLHGAGPYNITWNFLGGIVPATSTEQFPEVRLVNTGIWEFNVTVHNGACAPYKLESTIHVVKPVDAWTRIWQPPGQIESLTGLPASMADSAGICMDQHGNLRIAAGIFKASDELDSLWQKDICLLTCSAAGRTLEALRITPPAGLGVRVVRSFIPNPQGGWYLLGVATPLSNPESTYWPFILRLDQEGFPTWARLIEADGAYLSCSLAVHSNGSVSLVGLAQNPSDSHLDLPYVVRLDGNGNVLWSKVVNRAGAGTPVAAAVIGGLCVAWTEPSGLTTLMLDATGGVAYSTWVQTPMLISAAAYDGSSTIWLAGASSQGAGEATYLISMSTNCELLGMESYRFIHPDYGWSGYTHEVALEPSTVHCAANGDVFIGGDDGYGGVFVKRGSGGDWGPAMMIESCGRGWDTNIAGLVADQTGRVYIAGEATVPGAIWFELGMEEVNVPIESDFVSINLLNGDIVATPASFEATQTSGVIDQYSSQVREFGNSQVLVSALTLP